VQEIRPIVRALLKWYRANARDLPWRRTTRPYPIWVSEIMLQQTQVATVIPYWKRWMKALPSTKALAEAPEEHVLKLWEGLGYYSRARNLQKAAQQVRREHRGSFPDNLITMLTLPGIGRYTAGAIASIAFNKPAPIVDGNVIRVATRLFGIDGNPREKQLSERIWDLASKLVAEAERIQRPDERNCSDFNQSLMELGALICVPMNPDCPRCPLKSRCAAFRENRVEQLPAKAKQTPATPRSFIAFVIEHRNRFLVCQRPDDVVNAKLWEFPNVETTESNLPISAHAQDCLGWKQPTLDRFTTVKHSITRYRITLEAHRARVDSTRNWKKPGAWLQLDEIEKLAFTSAHRKILKKLIALKDKSLSAQNHGKTSTTDGHR
jgi:A/G-specific adenine glycosylase